MANQRLTEYRGHWVELTEQQEDGLFLAGIRISKEKPGVKSVKCVNLAPERIVCFDFDIACQEAFGQAQKHIDASLQKA